MTCNERAGLPVCKLSWNNQCNASSEGLVLVKKLKDWSEWMPLFPALAQRNRNAGKYMMGMQNTATNGIAEDVSVFHCGTGRPSCWARM